MFRFPLNLLGQDKYLNKFDGLDLFLRSPEIYYDLAAMSHFGKPHFLFIFVKINKPAKRVVKKILCALMGRVVLMVCVCVWGREGVCVGGGGGGRLI